MEKTIIDITCPRCGYREPIEDVEIKRSGKSSVEPIYVIENIEIQSQRINEICPRCGKNEAYKKIFSTQGEHAGVKQERYVEQYQCINCLFKWTKY